MTHQVKDPYVVSRAKWINTRLHLLVSWGCILALGALLYVNVGKVTIKEVIVKDIEYVNSYVPQFIKLTTEDLADLNCLAKNIYHEGRGEITGGKYGIGHVTANRVNHEDFPNNFCDVVYQRTKKVAQFSWTNDGLTDVAHDVDSLIISQKIAYDILFLDHEDITDGALYYHLDDGKTKFTQAHYNRIDHGGNLGKHAFYGMKQ